MKRQRGNKSLTDSEKIYVRKRRLKPLKETQKMTGKGSPWEIKNSGSEEQRTRGQQRSVDIQQFLERLRRELIADGLERRQGLTVMDLSPTLAGPESTFPEIELEIPESQTSGNFIPGRGLLEIPESRTLGTPIPGRGELRIPESLTPGNVKPGWSWKLNPPPPRNP